MAGCGGDRDETAHRMADEDRRTIKGRVGDHGGHLVAPEIQRVHVSSVAVAMAGQIERRHRMVGEERRRDVAPPVGVGGPAVDEHDAGSAGIAPREVVDRRTGDLHPTRRGFLGESGGEPPGRMGHGEDATGDSGGRCRRPWS